MNLVLLHPADFVDGHRAVLRGRRREHIANVHRAAAGDELVVGLIDAKVGSGKIERLDPDEVELSVILDREPPSALDAPRVHEEKALHAEGGDARDDAVHHFRPRQRQHQRHVERLDPDEVELSVILDREPPSALDVTLVLALPRPKVMNRVIASVTSLGVKRLFLVNSWRVEKSYWSTPRLAPENLREQAIAGLEQARDTVMPQIELRRFFRRFVEDELPAIAAGTTALVAHPRAADVCPRAVEGAVTLAVGPEGGFIDAEIASLERAGFRPVSLGGRVLRVETAVAALIARLK